ncbi:hypothetical protein T484DRAFT_1937574 [Baffinella frigidus]|nr:hypothetical protein T484DRAFT_1937574 [Cryptophyta sp. CCMP2293]
MFTTGTVARSALGMMLVAGAVPGADAFHVGSTLPLASARGAMHTRRAASSSPLHAPGSCACSSCRSTIASLNMAAEPRKHAGAQLAAAAFAVSLMGGAPHPAAAAPMVLAPAAVEQCACGGGANCACGVATTEVPSVMLALSDSELSFFGMALIAGAGAYAASRLPGSKSESSSSVDSFTPSTSSSTTMGPSESKKLGNKVAWKPSGPSAASALFSGVSLEDKAAVMKVFEKTNSIRIGSGPSFPLGVALAQLEGIDNLDMYKIHSIDSVMPKEYSFDNFATAIQLYTGKTVSWAPAPVQ